MLRKLLGVAAALAFPAVLAGQAPSAPTAGAVASRPHGVATLIQGEVVGEIDEMHGVNNQEGVEEADGQNNDVDDGKVGQEGEDFDEPEGLNNESDVSEQDVAGEDRDETGDDTPAPPAGAGQIGQVGRHRP